MSTFTLFANPYINFQGKAREAMTYYQNILGGKLDLLAIDDKGQMHPAGPDESLMHARLVSDGAVIMGTDGSPEYPPTWGDNMAVSLIGYDRDRMIKAFDGLSEGGSIKMPLSKSSWGDEFGYLVDKFGINWMVDITTQENMDIG